MPKQIQLLLTENVDNLGIVGDVVAVKPGYARNFLLPRALATTPTPRNIEKLAERRKQVEEELRQLRAAQQGLVERLEGVELTIQRSANEQGILYGGISQHDITEALREEGFTMIEDRHVRIGVQIKRLDSYMIPIVLAPDLKTEIKLWVVSDKPIEELEAQTEGEAEGEGEREKAEARAPKGKPARPADTADA